MFILDGLSLLMVSGGEGPRGGGSRRGAACDATKCEIRGFLRGINVLKDDFHVVLGDAQAYQRLGGGGGGGFFVILSPASGWKVSSSTFRG